MPIPGHSSANWDSLRRGGAPPPTPAEIRSAFQEHDGPAPSADSWAVLLRLYFVVEEVGTEPCQWGCLFCRPDPEWFDAEGAEQLAQEGLISSDRLAELDAGAEPSPEEVAEWQDMEVRRVMENADGYGFYAVFGWPVSDDAGNQRVLATLHVDQGSFERVAGLFASTEAAEQHLKTFGEFRWEW